ncbi:Type II/IV secretion system family protein [Nitrospira tepida]|uniref:Type II/IV secretion system family protein n=1 Tax=Nitrospira tepida TaxID=2973512 RepID=A0AA86T7T6_9BACT|nr:type IV pilus twitching motility protein PilT [Nitrospira tepida]CAI4033197.1 Type II/IV secretion system family protein [Nitrospira tepida]
MDISQLLSFGVKEGASDCHLSAGEPPMLRLHGDMKKVDMPPMTQEQVHSLVYDIMSDAQRKSFEEHLECDFSFALGDISRFRVNVFLQNRGLAAVFRTIPTEILPLEKLGMPPIVRQLCDREKGLILVTGPTGSGKSTTLAGMIDYLNNLYEGHVITIEDPIEFVHKSKKCLVNQRELGVHTKSFANALRSALREDPDIVLVGEMRDLETIQLALTAAETGHLVFATLHTSSAPKTVDRIIDAFPPNQQAQVRTQLAEALEAVLTQTLVKKKTGGRAAAVEILVATTAIRNLIREQKLHQIPGLMQASQKEGMQTMDMALLDLATRGVITKAEAQSRSMNPNLFANAV